MLCNLALDGLEACAKEAAGKPRPRPKVHVIRYADDLVATARTREMLVNRIIPAIQNFLQQRGLRLSEEKTKIVHIDDGFDFLGANVRKYRGKLLMKPTKANVIAIARDLKEYVRRSRGAAQPHLIHQVNRRLRGWANAFRHLVSSRAFRYVDRRLSGQLWRWARKRHGNKGKGWVLHRYYQHRPNGSRIFASRARDVKGRWQQVTLFQAGDLRIRRHVKVQCNVRIHDPAYETYFEERRKLQRNARWRDFSRGRELDQLELAWGA